MGRESVSRKVFGNLIRVFLGLGGLCGLCVKAFLAKAAKDAKRNKKGCDRRGKSHGLRTAAAAKRVGCTSIRGWFQEIEILHKNFYWCAGL
jgi:hypothetical protein